MASATLKPHISRTLADREFILGTAIEVGVVYRWTGNELSRCGSTYDWTLAGEIALIFAEIRSTVAQTLAVVSFIPCLQTDLPFHNSYSKNGVWTHCNSRVMTLQKRLFLHFSWFARGWSHMGVFGRHHYNNIWHHWGTKSETKLSNQCLKHSLFVKFGCFTSLGFPYTILFGLPWLQILISAYFCPPPQLHHSGKVLLYVIFRANSISFFHFSQKQDLFSEPLGFL